MTSRQDLVNYYSNKSKHSNYQVLPTQLQAILSSYEIQTRTRYEVERLAFLLRKINFKAKTILDIGGNTGYFTFEVLNAGAKSVHNFEGNKQHAEFVRLAAEVLGLQNKIKVTQKYFPFKNKTAEHNDIILLFNVLHHVGDDYGDKKLTLTQAKKEILKQLNSLATSCETLVFQMGFNWQGNVKQGLFKNGTKKEMIDFIEKGIKAHWKITSIGIAVKHDSKVVYEDLNIRNIERDDSLGEFLNRPIFILKSKAKL